MHVKDCLVENWFLERDATSKKATLLEISRLESGSCLRQPGYKKRRVMFRDARWADEKGSSRVRSCYSNYVSVDFQATVALGRLRQVGT